MMTDSNPETMREKRQGTRNKVAQKTAETIDDLSHASLLCDDGLVSNSKETILSAIEKIRERQDIVFKRAAG